MENMDDAQSDLLDRYLRGEMSPKERADWEAALAKDPALQDALAERRDLVRGIRDAVWSDLRSVMDAEVDAMEREEQEERQRWRRKIGLWVGAGAVLLLVGLWFGWLWFFKIPPAPLPVPEDLALEKLEMEKSTWFTVHLDSAKQMEFKFEGDTAQDQKKVESRPLRQNASKTNQEKRPNTAVQPPVANVPKVPSDRSATAQNPPRSYLTEALEILKKNGVPLGLENPPPANPTQLPARRVLAAAGQKTSEEPLPAMPFKIYTDTAMQCVFLGSELRLFVPPDFAEGQPVEIVQLRGAGAADGYYLKVGTQIYPMKNDRGHPFRLEPTADAAALRLLLE